MTLFASFLAASIPMFLYLIFLWRLDKNERESFFSILRYFVWGAFGAILLGIIFSLSVQQIFQIFITNENQLTFIGAVFIAPLIEESTKGIYLLFTVKKKNFDNITDGLVYGGAIGLGFGMTENLMYFLNFNENVFQWASMVFIRSVFSAVMHGIATATFGAFLAKWKFTNSRIKNIYPFIGLSLAMFFHFLWNFSVTFQFTFGFGILFMIFLIIIFLILFKQSINSERKLIKEELAEESEILNLPVLKELNFSSKYLNVFDERSSNKLLKNLSAKLAFRKFQVKNTNGDLRENYIADIELYRKKILELFLAEKQLG